MLEILKAIIFGIVEGVTEWLPVSSTGHIILLNEWLKFDLGTDQARMDAFMEMYDVVIQLGAILAVVVLFFKKIWPFGLNKKKAVGTPSQKTARGKKAEEFFPEKPRRGKKREEPPVWHLGSKIVVKQPIFYLWVKIVVACIPGVLYGFILDDKIEEITDPCKAIIVAVMLIVVGILFIVIENIHKGKTPKVRSLAKLSYSTALIIGVAQLIAAALPGTSRSGATIIAGLLLGLSRSVAAEFTFYLAIPTMFGASAIKLLKFVGGGISFTGMEMAILLVSMIVAFAVSLFVIRFLMDYIRKHDFKIFGYYRIVLGAIVLLYFMLR